MRRYFIIFAGLMVLVIAPGRPGLAAEPPSAVASIGPLHALLTHVTRGISIPAVVLPPGVTPHHYSLRPSDIMRLEQAAIIFWVGPALEGALVNPIRALENQTTSIALMEANGVDLLARREGGVLEDLPSRDPVSADTDPHIWLDPRVASVTLGIMADALAKIDPAHASLYADNARDGQQALNRLETEVSTYLDSIKHHPYVVFHDAYRYFENRFNLRPKAIVSVDSDHPPGARRINAIRDLLLKITGMCMFVEPQSTPKLIDTLRDGTDVKLAILDPIGIINDSGLSGYESMIWLLAKNMRDCLEKINQ